MAPTDTRHEPAGIRVWFERDGWLDVWHLLYLATLAAATVAAISDSGIEPAERAGMAALAIASAGWYLLIARRWRYWEAPPGHYTLLLGVAAALWVPLVRWHPAYTGTVFAAYGIAACPWLRRAIPTVIALTGLLALLDHTDGTALTVGEIVGLCMVGAVVILAHATIGGIARESERRRRLIDELESTRADLARREHESGALAERQRLARDIHDGLAQGFAGIVTLLEAADARLPSDAIDARAAIDQARQTARDSLAETRRLVWALREDHDDPRGALLSALERLAERTRPAGPPVEVVETGHPHPIDSTTELVLLRTAQEAVANAARHADASAITITLSWLGDHVILDIADDGSGIDPGHDTPRSDHTGFGLLGLRERAATVDATLDIDSRPGEGTTVTLNVPAASTPRPSIDRAAP